MMSRIKAQQEVKEVRDRIKTHAINKIDGKILSVNGWRHTNEFLYSNKNWIFVYVLKTEIFEAKITGRDATLDEDK